MDHEQWLEQHDRMIADHDRGMEAMREASRKAGERHDREIKQIREILSHAVRLAVREARNERAKRREIDDHITKLAAAQLVTEEKLQRLLERDERRYGGNGNQPAAG